ncbi:MAG: DUF5131 family protein [Alsobacter sp.]
MSEGCRHCYAERLAGRFSGKGQPYEGLVKLKPRRQMQVDAAGERAYWNGEVLFVTKHLADPLKWKRPRRIFVNSMSDLFHERLTNEQIAAIFGVMAACPQHQFQVLTKRAKRMREWFEWVEKRAEDGKTIYPNDEHEWRIWQMPNVAARRAGAEKMPIHHGGAWPLRNVWIGVSVENQAAADERIPELLRTPAAVRFISCEPLLGRLALRDEWMLGRFMECPDEDRGDEIDPCAGCPAVPNDGMRGSDYCGAVRGPRLDWIIGGCESGPGARPCDVDWLRSLRDQCAAADVPFFLKQAKPWDEGRDVVVAMGVGFGPGSKRKPGGVIELPYLDGIQHASFPEART